MMLSANTAMRCTAPPENMLNMSSTPWRWPSEARLEGRGIDAGQRDVGAEAEHDQRAQREPDAFLEFLGLAERSPVDIRRELFGRRRHEGAPSLSLLRRNAEGLPVMASEAKPSSLSVRQRIRGPRRRRVQT